MLLNTVDTAHILIQRRAGRAIADDKIAESKATLQALYDAGKALNDPQETQVDAALTHLHSCFARELNERELGTVREILEETFADGVEAAPVPV